MNRCLHIISRAVSKPDLQQCVRVLGPECALVLVGAGLQTHTSLAFLLSGQQSQCVYLVDEESELQAQQKHQVRQIAYVDFVDLCVQFPTSRTW